MPSYDYKCENCNKKFTITCTISEHEKKRVSCPKCSSRKVKQQVSSFFAVTSHKG